MELKEQNILSIHVIGEIMGLGILGLHLINDEEEGCHIRVGFAKQDESAFPCGYVKISEESFLSISSQILGILTEEIDDNWDDTGEANCSVEIETDDYDILEFNYPYNLQYDAFIRICRLMNSFAMNKVAESFIWIFTQMNEKELT